MSREFPVRADEDSYVTRREFTKFLGLSSLAFFLGTAMAAGRRLWTKIAANQAGATRVIAVDEIPVSGYTLFRYPTGDDPCILLRLAQDRFAAYNQQCTHLSCPVVFNGASRQLECPCHKGSFSAEDGRVIAGPPKRGLDALKVSIRKNEVWVKYESES
jgi:Rieske Fe-S protein